MQSVDSIARDKIIKIYYQRFTLRNNIQSHYNCIITSFLEICKWQKAKRKEKLYSYVHYMQYKVENNINITRTIKFLRAEQ